MATLTPRFDFDGYDPIPRNNLRALLVNPLVRQVHATLLPDWNFKATGDGPERFCDKVLLKWALPRTVPEPLPSS